MCGIYGFIGKPTDSERILDTFIDLGIETESRGTHATGYYGVNATVHTHKAPIKASEFYLEAKEFYTFYEHIPTVLIGHNRYASSGSPKYNKNNHPFINERFGFIHNGCVQGWVKKDTLGITTESDCDSEWIFKYFLKTLELHHGNIMSAIKKTLHVFDEATVACAMVDSKTKKLYLFRNIGNPICYIVNKEQKTILFASTDSILKAALELQKLPTEKIIEIEKGEIVCIDEDLNITKEECSALRTARSSYMSTISKAWKTYTPPEWVTSSKPKKVKHIESNNGWKCLKCGKKFINEGYVIKHLEDYHHFEQSDDNDITEFYEDLSAPKSPVFRLSNGETSRPLLPAPTINRKSEFGDQLKLNIPNIKKKSVIIKRGDDLHHLQFIKDRKKFTSSYSSFEAMQKDTAELLKQMKVMLTKDEFEKFKDNVKESV